MTAFQEDVTESEMLLIYEGILTVPQVAKITGLPLEKFQERHTLKKRVDALFAAAEKVDKFGQIAKALPTMTFGNRQTAQDLYNSL